MLIPITLVLIYSVLGVKSDCGWDNSCEWDTWEPWNDCTATCGGGNRNRSRDLCCPMRMVAREGVTCLTVCHSDSYSESESEACATTCYNGGAYSSSSCICSGRYYGVCCQSGKYFNHQILFLL